jgi:hypothetical protein
MPPYSPTESSQTVVPITREIVHYLEPDPYAVRRNNGRSGSGTGRGMKIAPGIAVKGDFLDAVCPVDPGAAHAEAHVPPAAQGRADQEAIDDLLPRVLRIVARWPSRLRRQRRADLGQDVAAGLVQADQRPLGIRRPLLDVQHVLHVPDERASGFRNAPLRLQPGLERVCLKVRRTGSAREAVPLRPRS